MPYIDGFLLPVPIKNLTAYRAMARKAGKVWREYGALQFRECVGDELEMPWAISFKKVIKAKPDETVLFSWIVYKSKADRTRITKKVMKDPRILASMKEGTMPFDPKRMACGGFKILVDL